MSRIFDEVSVITEELIDAARMNPEDILVVGCSTSEVLGYKIGKASDTGVAADIFEALIASVAQHEMYLAVQCCEHLNRALVIERKAAEKYDLEIVNVVPQLHAGGALAMHAYHEFRDPVVVENIKARAKAGIDIGQTLVGMHIHPVVVPFRATYSKIGEAVVTCGRSRPKFIGGERAEYNNRLR